MHAAIGTFAFIGGIGPWEMAIVLAIVLILFGAGKLPQVFRSMGEGMKAFREGQRDGTLEVDAAESER